MGLSYGLRKSRFDIFIIGIFLCFGQSQCVSGWSASSTTPTNINYSMASPNISSTSNPLSNTNNNIPEPSSSKLQTYNTPTTSFTTNSSNKSPPNSALPTSSIKRPFVPTTTFSNSDQSPTSSIPTNKSSPTQETLSQTKRTGHPFVSSSPSPTQTSKIEPSPSQTMSSAGSSSTSVSLSSSSTPLSTSNIPSTVMKNTTTKKIHVSSSFFSTQTLKTSSLYTSTSSTTSSERIPTVAFPRLSEFAGQLVLSLKTKRRKKRSISDFRKVSNDIETLLDGIYKNISGYVHSRVLQITRNNKGFLSCDFNLLIKKTSKVNIVDLRKKILEHNETKGFGNFTLHSVGNIVETDDPLQKAKTEEKLKLWIIVVMALLGALCLFFIIILICQTRYIKKLKKGKEESTRLSGKFEQFPVFDGIDETKNIPLKLTGSKTKLSATDSQKPLTSGSGDNLSETEGAGMSEVPAPVVEDVKEGDVKEEKPQNSSGSEDVKKETETAEIPDKSDEKEKLQIQDVKDDESTKLSTFSRKK